MVSLVVSVLSSDVPMASRSEVAVPRGRPPLAAGPCLARAAPGGELLHEQRAEGAGGSADRLVGVAEPIEGERRGGHLGLDDDLHATVRIEGPWGRCETRLGLRGAHQAVNAAMAAAVARHCGVDLEAVAAGLAAAHGSKWRMDLQRSPLGVLVINDAYNANPASMMAAIDALATVGASGRRIAVLGAMRELGELSAEAHAAVGVRLVQRSIDMLVAVGADGEVIADAAVEAGGLATVERVPDADSATALLRSEIARGDVVLVKASRAVGLERVAEALLGLGEGHPS